MAQRGSVTSADSGGSKSTLEGLAGNKGGKAQLFSDSENEEFDQIRNEIGNFDDYEKQFQEVLMTLENDDILEAFRIEYAGLHHSFLKSHEGESRLLRKCTDLQNDIYACVSKAHTAEELTLSDKQTIENLKLECETTSKKCVQSKDKEGVLREKIGRLKKDVIDLERIAKEPVEAAAQEAALQSLLRVHEAVLKERETQEQLVSTVQYDMTFAERRLQKLRDSKSTNDAELRVMKEAVVAKQAEVAEVMSSKSRKEEELRAARENVSRRTMLLAERQKKVDHLTEEHTRNGEELRRTIEETASLTEEYQALCRQLQNANNTLQDCNEDNDVLQRKTKETTAELQAHQANVVATHKQYVKESKILEALNRRNVVAEQRRMEAQQQRDVMRDAFVEREEEFARLKKEVEADEKQLASVHRERDLLFQEFLSADQQAQRNVVWLAEKRTQMKYLEHELCASEEHAQRQTESIYRVTKECLSYEEQTKKYAFACAMAMAEVSVRERQLAATQRDMKDTETRIHQQQAMLDSVIADRNSYAKHYGQLRSELSAMNKKFSLVLLQIQQMKDEVSRREHYILAADEEIVTLQRQRKELEAHIIAFQRRTEKKSRAVGQFTAQLRKLSEVLAEAHEEVTRQRRRCRSMIHERDLLTGQTVQRSKELTTLYERMHTQQSLLQRAEAMYRERVQHIDQLQYQVAALAQQLENMKRFVERLPDLRVMVNTARRDLTRQQVKVRAMLDDCTRPLNLHPSHALAWSEPQTFELVERTRKLQRELNLQRQQLSEKEAQIEYKEQEYMKAKAAVAKQPGPEVAEQLSAYQEALVKKKGQMKQMAESLRYFREQTEHYRNRHDELRARLAEMAKEYATVRDTQERLHRSAGDAAGGGKSGQLEGEVRKGEGSEAGGEGDFVYAGFVAPPLEEKA